jgi:hypothetical protein
VEIKRKAIVKTQAKGERLKSPEKGLKINVISKKE